MKEKKNKKEFDIIMSCGIYKITNKINGKSYIGQSIHIESRWTDEKYVSNEPMDPRYKSSLSKAFRKYGFENFKFEILEECLKEDLSEKEIYYISLYDTYYNGYNETTGGEGSSNYCMKISVEDLKEIYNLLLNTNIPQKEIAKQFNVGEDVISTINHGKSRRQSGYNYPLRNNFNPKKYCIDCGKEINIRATRCDPCAKKLKRVVEWPTREELKDLIRNKPFTTIAKKYNVSDNAIRKWCDFYELPRRTKEIKSYSDIEWQNI